VYYDAIGFEDNGDTTPLDTDWNFTAFEDFKKSRETLQCASSYFLPEAG